MGGVDAAILAKANGDIGKMSPKEKAEYYQQVCESLGLNPLTQPFKYLKLSGRETLYATRDAADQLRKKYRVSVRITSRETVDGIHIVTARASMPDGREDESTGCLPLGGLKGENLSNALMKAETKAKRRVTLSICGLGWLDETEVDSIDGAQRMDLDDRMAVAAEKQVEEAKKTEQRHRVESDEWADLVIKDIGELSDDKALFSWVRCNALQMGDLHRNAKARLWRALRKQAEVLGVSSDEVRSALHEEAVEQSMDGRAEPKAKPQSPRKQQPEIDDNPIVKFGRDKGSPAREVMEAGGAGSLDWYINAIRKSIEDPDKARFKEANMAHMMSIQHVVLDFEGGSAHVGGVVRSEDDGQQGMDYDADMAAAFHDD
jgi:hypothetical protein